MAQFVPSSYLTFAWSKKGFENWLRSMEEAIFSIGNYLKSNGWKRTLSLQRKKGVLWHYNHSEPYVETVMKVAQKLRPEAPRKPRQSPAKVSQPGPSL